VRGSVYGTSRTRAKPRKGCDYFLYMGFTWVGSKGGGGGGGGSSGSESTAAARVAKAPEMAVIDATDGRKTFWGGGFGGNFWEGTALALLPSTHTHTHTLSSLSETLDKLT